MQIKSWIIACLILLGGPVNRQSGKIALRENCMDNVQQEMSNGNEIIRLSVHPNEVKGKIDNKIYGQFLEHIYHSVNGGIWGEVIWNRSFEETGSREWNRRFDEIASTEIWSYGNGVLMSPVSNKETRFNIGDGSWRDLDYTVEACRTEGSGNLVIGVHSGSFNRCYALVLGSSGDPIHKLQRYVFDKPNFMQVITTLDSLPGMVQTGQWHKIRIRCEASNMKVWLDGIQIFDQKDTLGQQFGQTTVGTINAVAHFRNFTVTSLDGEVLYNGTPAPVRHWQAMGKGMVQLDEQNPLNDNYCLKIIAVQDGTGIKQNNFFLEKGDTCRGSLWLRGEMDSGLILRFMDGNHVVFEKDIPVPSVGWKEYPLEVTADKTVENGSLQLISKGNGTFWLDQISLTPVSARKNGGYRTDLFEAVSDIKPTIIRWPGGSFINDYIWQNGIGPQKERKGKKGWDELDPLSFGIDEFIDFCHKLKAEPLIPLAVNIEDPKSAGPIIDLIEYCNGDPSTKWGAVRTKNGHAQPYHVKYWEIGNEEWGMGAEKYAEVVKAYVPLMRKSDPSIKIAVCGSGGLSLDGRGLAYNRIVIEKCADLADYISIHHYENPDNYAKGPGMFETFWRENEKIIRESKNPQLKIFVSEWNAQSVDWRSGLYCGGLLNEFEKASELVAMATPALWLRHVSAPQWDNAFINFNHRTWFPGANYLVMKLWREHYAAERIEVKGFPDSLNIVATRSEDAKIIYIKAVNTSRKAVPLEINIARGFNASDATMQLIAPGDTHAVNSIENPYFIKIEHAMVTMDGSVARLTMPMLSAGVITIKQK